MCAGEAVQVLRLLGINDSKYDADPDMATAVERLIEANPSQRPGLDSMRLGQGVWEVRLWADVCWIFATSTPRLRQTLRRHLRAAPSVDNDAGVVIKVAACLPLLLLLVA